MTESLLYKDYLQNIEGMKTTMNAAEYVIMFCSSAKLDYIVDGMLALII